MLLNQNINANPDETQIKNLKNKDTKRTKEGRKKKKKKKEQRKKKKKKERKEWREGKVPGIIPCWHWIYKWRELPISFHSHNNSSIFEGEELSKTENCEGIR